jgi:hypothetical protein
VARWLGIPLDIGRLRRSWRLAAELRQDAAELVERVVGPRTAAGRPPRLDPNDEDPGAWDG